MDKYYVGLLVTFQEEPIRCILNRTSYFTITDAYKKHLTEGTNAWIDVPTITLTEKGVRHQLL